MIQDILPLHLQNQYEKTAGRYQLYDDLQGEQDPCKGGETLAFLTYREPGRSVRRREKWRRRASICFPLGRETYFLTELPEHLTPEGYCFEKMFAVRSGKPKEHILRLPRHGICMSGIGITGSAEDADRNSCTTERCGCYSVPHAANQVFPKIAPAVIVGVTDGEYILMTTYANREYKRYALIAGFTEIGGDGGGDGHAGSAGGSRS